jgi:hypothetical protein
MLESLRVRRRPAGDGVSYRRPKKQANALTSLIRLGRLTASAFGPFRPGDRPAGGDQLAREIERERVVEIHAKQSN